MLKCILDMLPYLECLKTTLMEFLFSLTREKKKINKPNFDLYIHKEYFKRKCYDVTKLEI